MALARGQLRRHGAAFLFTGQPSGLTPKPVWITRGRQATAEFGRSVSGAGDVNGDGLDDVLVGAPMYNDGERDEGGAFEFLAIP